MNDRKSFTFFLVFCLSAWFVFPAFADSLPFNEPLNQVGSSTASDSVGPAFKSFSAPEFAPPLLNQAVGESAFAQNILTNGSFESYGGTGYNTNIGAGLTGWTIGHGGGVDIIVPPYWWAYEGNVSLSLNWIRPERISQVVTTTPGARYRLSFYMAAEIYGGRTVRSMNVLWNGQIVGAPTFLYTGQGPTSMGWREFVYEVVGTGNDTLTFQSTTPANYGPALDAVSLIPLDEIEVKNVVALPDTLWIDQSGAGSGIVFRAEISTGTVVQFKVKTPGNVEIPIGSAQTEYVGGQHIAKLSWWGKLGETIAAIGPYRIIAEVGPSRKDNPFTISKVDAYVINMGKWMLANKKDPSAIVPEDPKIKFCPLETKTWDEAITEKNGHFSGFPVGDPVNIVSGNFAFPETDLLIKSREPLSLARIYNSLDAVVTPFGRGWSSPYFSHLEFIASDVLFINSDGSRLLFKQQGTQFIGPAETDLKLALATDTGFWMLNHPNGLEWAFNSDGKIIRMAKACCGRGAADAILLDYDSNGHLHRVTNSLGQWFEYSFNPGGQIAQITDSFGRVLQYSYDNNANLLSFTDPIGRVTTYSYTEDWFLSRIQKPGNRITNVTYADLRVSTVTSPDGGVSRFEWDLTSPKFTLTDPTGVIHEYYFNADWRLITYVVPSLGLNKNFISSGSTLIGFQDSLGENQSFHFDEKGLLESKTDALGNTSHYEYHPTFNKLTKKTDVLGREWRYSWCYRGNLISETDPSGGTRTYTFDAHNNRTSMTDQLGRITRWIYDASGNNLVQVVNAQGAISGFSYDMRGNLISSSDQLGRITQFQYDLLDRLTRTVYPDGRVTEIEYDGAGNVSVRRDNLGRETHYSYDLSDRFTTLTRPDGTTFSYAYNAAGQKISETDPLGRVIGFEYSPLGLLTKTIYPDSSFETFAYDTENRLVSKTDELGHIMNFEYDPLGRLLATIDPTGARWESVYDSVGRKTADKDPLNRVTSYQFDVLDRVTKVTRPDGSFVSNSFDAVGNLLSTVDALGNAWSWVYDDLNRQVRAIQPNGASSTTIFDAAGQVTTETDALGRTTQYAFDNGGRRTATTDALGNVWRNFYDAAGRLTSVVDPIGAVSSVNYDIMDRVVSQSDPLGNVTSFEFDAGGRRVAKTDASGRRSITAYDLRDRVTNEVDPEGYTVSYGYNLAGQRVSLTDGANRVWRWDLDSLGRAVAEIDPAGNINRYAFDSVGNRISWTNARNQVTNYTFDLMNRLTHVSYPDGTLAAVAYDLEGRELSRTGPAGTVTKTYDSVGNMTSETFGPWGKKWQYSFDLVGNRVAATDPEGRGFKYRFDALNRMTKLDPPEKGDEITFAFDAAGRLITEDRPGVRTTNTFDLAGRLLRLKHERDHGKGKLVASRQYTYSPAGNRLSMADENGELTQYFYNNSDWLTKAQYPDGQQVSYNYNGAGDRVTETIETPTVKKAGHKKVIGTDTVIIPFGYDPAGRMISRSADVFSYDADGNLVSAVESGNETRYFWSSDNRLTKVERDIECPKHGKKKCKKCPQIFTVSEEYGYVPESWKRITRSIDGLQFVSVYDGDDESHEYLVKETKHHHGWKCPKHKKCHCPPPTPEKKLELVRQFIGGPGTDDLVSTKYHGRSLNMLKDGLGSTIALTNKGGHTVARIGYDAWGQFRWPDKPGHGKPPCDEKDLGDWLDRFDFGRSFGPGPDGWHWGRHFGRVITPYLYTSRKFDTFSQLYGNRNRMYNPRVGRFLTKDPISFEGGLNLFSYCNNNPVTFWDPFGLKWVFAWVKKAQDVVLYAHREGSPGDKRVEITDKWGNVVKVIYVPTGTYYGSRYVVSAEKWEYDRYDIPDKEYERYECAIQQNGLKASGIDLSQVHQNPGRLNRNFTLLDAVKVSGPAWADAFLTHEYSAPLPNAVPVGISKEVLGNEYSYKAFLGTQANLEAQLGTEVKP